jgi:uncharacterized protein YndB with AHSA1/START domain
MAPISTTHSDTLKVTAPSDREICITRLFGAPRHLVFEAMTKPEHIRQWWGRLGEGYTVSECEVDLRPGGAWRFVNRIPSGELVAFRGIYREIEPPARMVYTEIYERFPDTESLITATFSDEKGGTRLTVSCIYPTKDVRDMVLKSGMEHGAAISYDRLEDVAQAMASSIE